MLPIQNIKCPCRILPRNNVYAVCTIAWGDKTRSASHCCAVAPLRTVLYLVPNLFYILIKVKKLVPVCASVHIGTVIWRVFIVSLNIVLILYISYCWIFILPFVVRCLFFTPTVVLEFLWLQSFLIVIFSVSLWQISHLSRIIIIADQF